MVASSLIRIPARFTLSYEQLFLQTPVRQGDSEPTDPVIPTASTSRSCLVDVSEEWEYLITPNCRVNPNLLKILSYTPHPHPYPVLWTYLKTGNIWSPLICHPPKPTPAPAREETANETIIQITDSDKNLTADQILNTVQQHVRLQQSGLYVLKTKRDNEQREVVVTFKNNYKAKSIVANALADTNLVVKEISIIPTGVEIHEAPGHLSEEETIEALYDNNHELHVIPKEKFTTSIVRMV
ncbi:unnamed protein product [Bemisia tabaci]|uniref:Uncharacterized protein n=1 Tax=Bemisia tabaci TaxID=7038 RepID=A0A9P0A308_BEMTA|nr:unnamed protein product [Bemisia tabaci]